MTSRSQDATNTYLEEVTPWEEYILNQVKLLKKTMDVSDNDKTSRLSTLDTLCCQIVLFSHSTVLLSRSLHVSEAYLLSRSILDTTTNLCYLMICDQDEFDRYVDFSKRNIIRGIETRAKAFAAIGKSVGLPDIRSAKPYRDVFSKFISPKKGKDLTRWESDKSSSFEKKLIKISTNVPGFKKEFFEASRLFIYEDASEIAHGTLYGSGLCTGVFYGHKDYTSAVRYACGIITTLYLIIGALIDSIFLVVSVSYNVDEIKAASKKNFEIL